MAAKGGFFYERDPTYWRKVLQTYDRILHMKAKTKSKPEAQKELIDLDQWYQEELPIILNSRDNRHIKKNELEKLLTWKLARGKFRPMLPKLVASNSTSLVEEASTKAFSCLPNVSDAIKALSALKGVGPATASAVLSAGAPNVVPFMADESVLAVPSITLLKYDLNCYLEFTKAVATATKDLRKKDPEFGWTPHIVELTLWTYVMCEKLDPALLKTLKPDVDETPATSKSENDKENEEDVNIGKRLRKSVKKDETAVEDDLKKKPIKRKSDVLGKDTDNKTKVATKKSKRSK